MFAAIASPVSATTNPAVRSLCDIQDIGTHENGLNYDCFGYVPQGFTKPPDHIWSEMFDQNKNPPAQVLTHYKDNKPVSQAYNCGQSQDILSSFGVFPLEQAPKFAGTYASSENRFAEILQNGQWPLPLGNNSYDYGNGTTYPGQNLKGLQAHDPERLSVCTADNYPNCDMQGMREGAPIIQQRRGWWSAWTNAFGINQASTPGTIVDVMDLYVDRMEQEVAHFTAGGMTGLDSVNTCDTSAFDPCADAAFFGKIAPAILAVTFMGLVQKVILPALTINLPQITSGLLTTGLGGTGFFYGRMAVDYAGDRQENLDKAATSLSVGVTSAAFSYVATVANYTPTYQYAAAGVGALTGYVLLQEPFAAVINIAGRPIEFVIWLSKIVVDGIAYFICRLLNWGVKACNNVDGKAGCDGKSFPDARRWDASGIAYKLTKVACEREGWAIDSPQAEFVFRGLITGPMMQMAATADSDLPGAYKGFDTYNYGITTSDIRTNATHVNPLGHIAQHNDLCMNRPFGLDPYNFHRKVTWVGKAEADSLFGTNASENRYACQNFDILYNPDTESANPTGSDKVLKDNFHRWLFGGKSRYPGEPEFEGLVQKAYSNTNLMQQNYIPGLQLNNSRARVLPCAVYLKTCMNDFSGAEGFNTVNDRGRMAERYIELNFICEDYIQDHEMRANAYFREKDIFVAWDKILNDNWNEQDKSAIAWYLTDAKALDQADDFYVWAHMTIEDQFDRKTGDERVNAYTSKPRQPWSLLAKTTAAPDRFCDMMNERVTTPWRNTQYTAVTGDLGDEHLNFASTRFTKCELKLFIRFEFMFLMSKAIAYQGKNIAEAFWEAVNYMGSHYGNPKDSYLTAACALSELMEQSFGFPETLQKQNPLYNQTYYASYDILKYQCETY